MTESNKTGIPEVALLTECSWEVCNKIGGIYTVLSTKAVELKNLYGDNLVFIGPDLGQGSESDTVHLFKERKTLLKSFASKKLPYDLKVRTGRWAIPGSPLVVLVDFTPMFPHINELYGKMWENFGVDSLNAYGDYNEACSFAVAAAITGIELARHLKADPAKTIAHFNEWTTGMGLLYTKMTSPETATVFTTHATTVGRSICGNGKPLYRYFHNYNGDQMATELNVVAKHSVEKAAAWNADCFTTVSEVTARECTQLIGRQPDVVTPNGFEPSFQTDSEKRTALRKKGREKILKIASLLNDCTLPEDTFIVATSGRNEFRNKGLDIFLNSMQRISEKAGEGERKILALVLVPSWVKQPSGDLLVDLDFGGWIKPEPDYITHRLHNEDTDPIACTIRSIRDTLRQRGISDRMRLMFVPSYLDGNDGIVNISYYDFLPAIDLTVFASYYEPWGYTPLESIAFGVPTITTDKAGFGAWARENKLDILEVNGVEVTDRDDYDFDETADRISNSVLAYMRSPEEIKRSASKGALATAEKAEWKFFIEKYTEAFNIAFENATKRN